MESLRPGPAFPDGSPVCAFPSPAALSRRPGGWWGLWNWDPAQRTGAEVTRASGGAAQRKSASCG